MIHLDLPVTSSPIHHTRRKMEFPELQDRECPSHVLESLIFVGRVLEIVNEI